MRKAAGKLWYTAPIGFLLIASAVLAPAASKRQKAPKKLVWLSPFASRPLDEYVGADTCGACHPDEMGQFKKVPMAVLLTDKYPVQQRGCEACHGPGKQHMEAMAAGDIEKGRTLIFNPARHSAMEDANVCLACHEKDEKPSLFQCSRHLAEGISCIDCHDPHLLQKVPQASMASSATTSYFSLPDRVAEQEWLTDRLLRQNEPTLCYSCHKEIQAEFQLPIRHRVNEGLMTCTDCHNPMGTLNSAALKSPGTDVCYNCHVEKRGPYVYEHAAVRVEGCTVCHTPHGSINQHLLIRREQRQLCLECHVAPQAINVPHPRFGFQEGGECTRCHVEIHGSNYDPDFLR